MSEEEDEQSSSLSLSSSGSESGGESQEDEKSESSENVQEFDSEEEAEKKLALAVAAMANGTSVKRALLRPKQLAKAQALDEKLKIKLDRLFKVWVKDTTEIDTSDPDEIPREPFVLTLKMSTTVNEVKRRIRAHYEELGLDSTEYEPLNLVFQGKLLKPDTRLSEYAAFQRQRGTWSKPYAGIIWIVPSFLEPKLWKSNWGEVRERGLEVEMSHVHLNKLMLPGAPLSVSAPSSSGASNAASVVTNK